MVLGSECIYLLDLSHSEYYFYRSLDKNHLYYLQKENGRPRLLSLSLAYFSVVRSSSARLCRHDRSEGFPI